MQNAEIKLIQLMHYDPELQIKINLINIRKRCSQEPFDLENLAQIANAFH